MRQCVITGGALAFMCVTACGDVAFDRVVEPWAFDFDGRKWSVGNSKRLGTEQVVEYVLSGETIENWTELVTSYSSQKADRISVEDWLAGFTSSMKAESASFKWTELSRAENDVVFEW